MAKQERLYFIIRGLNGGIKYYDSHLNIMMSVGEFQALYKNGYFDKFSIIFDNYIEQ